MEPPIPERKPNQPKTPSQRPFGTYFSKPIVHWNTKCNFNRKDLKPKINERNIDNQLHSNYKDSSDDDDSNEHIHSRKHSKFTVTSMGFEFNINKDTEYDNDHRNNAKCCIDDVPLFALVNTEDTPNKNESRNYNITHTNTNNNINTSTTNSNINNEMFFLSKNISSVGMSDTSQLQDYEYSTTNGAKINMKDLICETDHRNKRNNNNNKHCYETLKKFKHTNNNNNNSISNNNTITNTSTKHNSSLKTSQLYYNTNNVRHIKSKPCLKLTNKTTLTKGHHRVINSITSNNNNNSSLLNGSKRTKTVHSFFTSKIKKVIQHKLSHFILNQKDDDVNPSITKIQLTALAKRTKSSKQQMHSTIKHDKCVSKNNNKCKLTLIIIFPNYNIYNSHRPLLS